MLEFKILYDIVDYMEQTGSTYKSVSIAIDEELLEDINRTSDKKYTLDELKKAADKCLAYEWLKASTINHQYRHLSITPKGVGAARSKRKSDEMKADRGLLKKWSDYIEDHKGLFVVLGFLLALATFATKLLGE